MGRGSKSQQSLALHSLVNPLPWLPGSPRSLLSVLPPAASAPAPASAQPETKRRHRCAVPTGTSRQCRRIEQTLLTGQASTARLRRLKGVRVKIFVATLGSLSLNLWLGEKPMELSSLLREREPRSFFSVRCEEPREGQQYWRHCSEGIATPVSVLPPVSFP